MPQPKPEFTIRTAVPEDAAISGQIAFDALSSISVAHGFPSDFPGPEASIGLLTRLFSHPHFYCVVAESEGRIIGSNCLEECSVISGVGPITVDLESQDLGAGRRLMQAVLDRAAERKAAGVRLVQAAFHNRSFSLYSALGFDVREPLACMQGSILDRSTPGCTVRIAQPEDATACNAVSLRVHGFHRAIELAEAIEQGTAYVVERGGRITGYTSHLALFGHTTAETNADLQALIASIDTIAGPGILVPSRNQALLRWCLANGLRVVQPMTLMSTGLYNEPAGAWLPSVTF